MKTTTTTTTTNEVTGADIQTEFLGFNADGFPIARIVGALSMGSGAIKNVDRIQPVSRLLQSGDGNTKLRKNRKRGFMTRGLSLTPHRGAGLGNLCPHASAGCISACLNHQGMASVWESIHLSRIAKTVVYYCAREWFVEQLATELRAAVRSADRQNLDLCCRLNVFSDIPWERIAPELFEEFSNVEFYDYTKNPNRAGLVRPNYWTTFSLSETNESDALELLSSGVNVAAVFTDGELYVGKRRPNYRLPKTWRGFQVINGDQSDLRFLDVRGYRSRKDTRGRIVGLKLKAASYHELRGALESGFAIHV